MDNSTALGLAVIALLTIGAGFGRASVDPVVVEEKATETIIKEIEVPGPTETIYRDRIPDVCMEALALAVETNQRTLGMLDQIEPMQDALAKGRRGIAGSDPGLITEAADDLTVIDSRSLDYLPPGDLYTDPLVKTMEECNAAVE